MAASETQPVLNGRGILVTRPAHQADRLCRLIEAAGGRPIRFPVLEIRPPADPDAVAAALGRLADYDLAVFISANAVQQALAAVGSLPWPLRVEIAAIGAATAQALTARGLVVTHCPVADFTSEALLTLPALQRLAGRRILILRGDGGRDQLRDTLRARGAQVDYLEVYRRGLPEVEPAPLLDRWRAGEIDAVMITSNESLRNLVTIVGTLGMPLLRATPLIVANARTAALARELGISGRLRIAADATDAAMTAALCAHFSERQSAARGD